MQGKELKKLRPRLGRFLRSFAGCIKTKPSRKHLETYVAGQISNLPRKNVEAIALARGVAPRSLQEFLTQYLWDHAAVRRKVQQQVMERHADDNAIAVIDETSFAKKGTKTAGVQRQYCGATGKHDNCVVSVHLGYAGGDFHTLVDADLYLPKSWLDDPRRCEEAGIPAETPFRAKPRIALDLLARSIDNGMVFRYLAADEVYGRSEAFRTGVADLGMVYVVDVPCSLTGWTKRAGKPAGTRPARRLDALWKRGGPAWTAFRVKDTAKGPVVWKVRDVRFFPSHDGRPGGERRLLIARNVVTREVKYLLSNAPADTPVEVLVHVAFSRWRIERLFQDAKGRLGMDEFEARKYVAVVRHLILTMVSLLFLVEQTREFQKKTPHGRSAKSGSPSKSSSTTRSAPASARGGSRRHGASSGIIKSATSAPDAHIARNGCDSSDKWACPSRN